MSKAKHAASELDRELDDLPEALRWREWMRRVEAVLFAASAPVSREVLTRLVGRRVSLDLLISDLRADLGERPYDVQRVGDAWMLQTRPAYGTVIRAASQSGDQELGLNERDMAVLAAVAYHQPITRSGMNEIFGIEVSRDRLARLRAMGLIAPGPRSPAPGAARAWVTTEKFLASFHLESLRDLPEPGQEDED